eukprot:sb/3464958/
MSSAVTADCYSDTCGISWKFDGEPLQNSSRVKINQFYSTGFAALTSDSVATAGRVGLKASNEFDRSKYPIIPEAIVYWNSVVTISGVTDDDLGVYTCNYSDPVYSYYSQPVLVERITLYSDENATEITDTIGIYSSLTSEVWKPSTIYAQCITYGGPTVWKARVATDDCPDHLRYLKNECEESSMMSLDDLKKQDFYHCFDFTEATSSDSQYGFSVIKFTDISCKTNVLDTAVFYCLKSGGNYWKGYVSLSHARMNAYDENTKNYQYRYAISLHVLTHLISERVSLSLFFTSCSDEGCISRSVKYRQKATGVPNKFPLFFVQSDPDLVTSPGERVFGTKSGWALNRGEITLIFLYQGKFIVSLNRGVTKSGVTKSGSDCIGQNTMWSKRANLSDRNHPFFCVLRDFVIVGAIRSCTCKNRSSPEI